MTRNLPVKADRIAADIDALAALTEPDRPWTRRAFTPMFLKGRAYLERRFKEAGLETRIDAAGNLIGLRKGAGSKGTIMLGSHSDTVPNGGCFDGIAGVAAALEVARSLDDAGIALEHDLEIIDFLAEEVSIFGVSCIGSRGMLGLRPTEWLEREADGMSLAEGIRMVGGDPAVDLRRGDIRAFLELHIEQGPVLEKERIDIGVVTVIAGITRIEIVVEGRADHAGTTPMGARRDALTAASRVVLGIERIASELAQGPSHFAATVGEFSMEPNAANVVPSHVRMLIDARAEDPAVMESFSEAVSALTEQTAKRSGVTITPPRRISNNPATPMAASVVALLEESAAGLDASSRRMVSGAGHDAAFLAKVAPAAMVFIACRDGRSHTPEEWADNDDIALGAAVLYETVLKLDRR
ncbi:N-carbamoyl-L-amino-acid hydrolase [Rhizobium petrolearium]|uniref:Zn-dependent hydrolase n=1 Tax=Neorhizobium petrolearium TaxID=515361 RepID=UPI001AE96CEC|nr:Zn-dependent hydrolase [Neorhizobium petrolearium]MBP1844810.1 N-carbamoyl-L-amino-acid hydrolase [Neorhizobium petrolearium]